MNKTALADRFSALSQLLLAQQGWWRPRAFVVRELPWEAAHPELSRHLRALSLEQSETLAPDDVALIDFLSPWIAATRALPALCDIDPAREVHANLIAAREPVGVPGRKWQQIQAFVGALADTKTAAVEWCAGKAHLGRWYTQHSGAAVDALEWNAELVDAGNRFSQRAKLPVQLHAVDVLADSSATFLQRDRQVLALHACGQLHVHLLQLCAQQPVHSIALAPCCYHLNPHAIYQPLSQAARAVDLSLSKLDLHTAVQESVTSPERVQKQRRQLQAWRLGFDVLQRDVRGVDGYLQTPSQPLSVLSAGFAAFCEQMAAFNQIELPASLDYTDYEQRGWQRFVEVTALDLPRVLFRRALELWLVLDRALFLQEHGYTVEVGTFCTRSLTPRNLLIRARL